MDAPTFLIQLVILLIGARLFGEMASRLQTPSVIGELIAGIVLGPSLLNWISLTPPIHLLAQIGVILLLFEVGLETNLGRLTAAGGKALSVALAGVLLPFGFGVTLAYFAFQFSLLTSLFVGATLTATSIGITLRVLQDLKQQSSSEAQVIIGAAVLDDILGILLLSMLYEFSLVGEINLWNTGKVTLFITLFFLFAPLAAKGASYLLKKWDEKTRIAGLIPTTIISLILFFAWLAHQSGAPEILGGFAAGLALSRQFFLPFATLVHENVAFSQRIEEEMRPIVHLFSPIFFVAIGLSLNFRQVGGDLIFMAQLTLTLLAVGVFGKLASGLFLHKERWRSRLIIGSAMVPRGEVGLIFANVGLTTGAFQNELYAALILVIALTTLLPPFFLRSLFKKRGGELL